MFRCITFGIQNNLVKLLNHPMQQMKKLRLREGTMHAYTHSAGQWGSQHLLYSRSSLFSSPLPPCTLGGGQPICPSALVQLGLQSPTVNAHLPDVTRNRAFGLRPWNQDIHLASNMPRGDQVRVHTRFSPGNSLSWELKPRGSDRVPRISRKESTALGAPSLCPLGHRMLESLVS